MFVYYTISCGPPKQQDSTRWYYWSSTAEKCWGRGAPWVGELQPPLLPRWIRTWREVADGRLVHGHPPLLLTWSLVDTHGDMGTLSYVMEEPRLMKLVRDVTCLNEPKAPEVEALSLATPSFCM